MDKFLNEINTPYFWLGVVFVNITINLFSGYISKFTSKHLANLNLAYQQRTKRKSIEYQKEIEKIKNSTDYRDQLRHLEICQRLTATKEAHYAITFLLLAILFLLASTHMKLPTDMGKTIIFGTTLFKTSIIVFMVISTFSFTQSTAYTLKAMSISEKLKLAAKKTEA